MRVYFENNRGELRVIAEVAGEKEAMKEIFKFLDEHNFKSYYQRMYTVPVDGANMTCIDVGSHTEFFYIEPPII